MSAYSLTARCASSSVRGFDTVIGASVVLVGCVDVVGFADGTGSLLVGRAETVTVTARSLGRSLVGEG